MAKNALDDERCSFIILTCNTCGAQLSGAAEARWAHNPKVGRSKLLSATLSCFWIDCRPNAPKQELEFVASKQDFLLKTEKKLSWFFIDRKDKHDNSSFR